MKLLLLIPFLFIFKTAYAYQEINLLCDVTYQKNNNRNEASQKIKTRVEVTAYKNGNVSIIPDSNLLASASTIKTDNLISVTNFSNASKWDVKQKTINRNTGDTLEVGIIIDRNAGSIAYSDVFQSGNSHLSSSGFGFCEKINPNVRKF
jgi:hypothetical protein